MNAFPALSTALVNGWVVRFSNGYAKRANSVNPIYLCSIDTLKNIEICEEMYSCRGLDTVFKLTECEAAYEIDKLLADMGYSYEAKTNVMLKNIKGFEITAEDMRGAVIYRELKDNWFNAYTIMNKVKDESKGTLRKMLESIIVDTYYACIIEDGKIIAVGQGVAERGYVGMFDIYVHEGHRRKGLANKIMNNLIYAAAQDGNKFSYLQVVDANEPAKALYDKLGYEKQYSYWYRVKKLVKNVGKKYDYNEISKIYDDLREADLLTVEFLINAAKLDQGSRVLEIGCGTGNYLKLIQELTKAEVWGIDSSSGMLGRAKEKCPVALLIEGDAVELAEIPENKFDLVYMVDVIHHIKDIEIMIKNISRVLKPNAAVVIFSDSYEHIRNRLTTKYFPETLNPELKRYPDTDEIKEALSGNGFREISDGNLILGDIQDYGARLIEIASKKGYSMFGLISDEAIKTGIERIKEDMKKQTIIYHQRAPYVIAVK